MSTLCIITHRILWRLRYASVATESASALAPSATASFALRVNCDATASSFAADDDASSFTACQPPSQTSPKLSQAHLITYQADQQVAIGSLKFNEMEQVDASGCALAVAVATVGVPRVEMLAVAAQIWQSGPQPQTVSTAGAEGGHHPLCVSARACWPSTWRTPPTQRPPTASSTPCRADEGEAVD